MFASLSSFLPSGLQQVAQPTRPPDPLARLPATPPVVDPPRKKEKKEKHANEAFIIVRPPPSKSVHPLSLQVQLVPPQSRNDRPIHALDSSPDDINSDLKRTNSYRSEASTTSGYTSAGSISSFASTASSGRRMIIPLYNLNVHSVMPTTILDAGTDAKVAKFVKRGLEVIGLAFLEPIEVRPSVSAPSSLAPPLNLRASIDDSLHEFGSPPSTRPVPQTRPHTSHATINTSAPTKSRINFIVVPPPPDKPTQRSTKNLFSIFRKKGKDSASPSSVTFTLPNDITPQPLPPRNTTLRSDDTLAHPDITHPSDPWPSSPTPSQTAVLGVYPTLYPPINKPQGRPTKYIWVVRKWFKGNDTGILNGVMGKLNAAARDTNVPLIEVRFEWSREQKKRSTRKSRQDKDSNPRASLSLAPRDTPAATSLRFAPQTQNNRSSILSHSSSGSDTGDSSPGSNAHRVTEESDDESDPEDSETPWTCVVVVRRLRQPSPQHQHNGVQESVIRVKAASLAPTPHHPKIVGLLKIPFPLPDVEVEPLTVRRRQVTTTGVSKTMSPKAGEFVLTAEEIKDTVSSTALWLVIREAFGGIGRDRRKGRS